MIKKEPYGSFFMNIGEFYKNSEKDTEMRSLNPLTFQVFSFSDSQFLKFSVSQILRFYTTLTGNKSQPPPTPRRFRLLEVV